MFYSVTSIWANIYVSQSNKYFEYIVLFILYNLYIVISVNSIIILCHVIMLWLSGFVTGSVGCRDVKS